MKNNKQWGYLAPELEVVHVEIEQGYAISDELNQIGFGNSGEAGGEIETNTQTDW